MMLSNRITAKRREAKPDIHARRSMVKVIKELNPAALVKFVDLTCLAVVFLSEVGTFLPEGAAVFLLGNIFCYYNFTTDFSSTE